MALSTNSRILVLDVETMMGKAYIWRMYEEVTNINMLLEPVTLLSWAAKFVGEDHTYFDSVQRNTREGMLENLWHLLDEADVVVGWNSNKFDLRHINAEFAEIGLGPPSPYRKVDLLQHVRRHMKFMSNKLEYVAQTLGIGSKKEHEGLGLWIKCAAGDKQAWATMEEYNIQDVWLTEDMFHRVRPWLPYTVNQSIEGGHCCTECGSTDLESRGVRPSATRLYDRWYCRTCGTWSQSVSARKDKKATLKKETL